MHMRHGYYGCAIIKRTGEVTLRRMGSTDKTQSGIAEHTFDDEAAVDRLLQEINVLLLEGSLFCPDPREAKRRTKRFTLNELAERPVTIEPNPNYGQPSVLAYRVLQAIFQKATEEGYPYPSKISFSQRELARLVGRQWSGAKMSRELYDAAMALRTTLIHCSLRNTETQEWEVGNFNMLSTAYFAGKGQSINMCVLELDAHIVNSLNRRHVAQFNLQRLESLDIIGMMLYKRLFYHFSNLNGPKTSREQLKFEKSYEDICREWLGGLKPEKYRSKILQNQFGRHLEGLRHTKLIRKCDIEPMADGKGFKMVFYPGTGFFHDYHTFYLERQQPRLRFKQTAAMLDIQRPIEVVARFHQRLGHQHNTFEEKETAYATKLLEQHTLEDLYDLIDFAIENARETGFDTKVQFFGAVSGYYKQWAHDKEARAVRLEKQSGIDACAFCNEQGLMAVKNRTGAFTMMSCPHDIQKITEIEETRELRRV